MAISFNSQGLNLDFSNPTFTPSSGWFPISYPIPPSSCVIGGMFINKYNKDKYLPAGTYDLVGTGLSNSIDDYRYADDGPFVRTGIAGGSSVAPTGSSLYDRGFVGLFIRRA